MVFYVYEYVGKGTIVIDFPPFYRGSHIGTDDIVSYTTVIYRCRIVHYDNVLFNYKRYCPIWDLRSEGLYKRMGRSMRMYICKTSGLLDEY